jgi:hypothetical protein
MNFLNPLPEIYLRYPNVDQYEIMPFYREVLWLFSKHLNNRLKMFKHRVNIEIEEVYSNPRNLQFGSIYAYQTCIDIEEFKSLDELAKRKIILNLVHSGFTSLATEHNWNKEFINDAYKKSIADNFKFVYHTDFKLSRNKKQKGRIRINLKDRLTTFTAEISDVKEERMMTTELLQTEQGNFAWWRSIKDFGWMDSDNFGIKLMKGEIWLTSNSELNVNSINFKPKKSKIEQLESYLKNLQGPI